MSTWYNADGLDVKWGRALSRDKNKAQVVNTLGHVVEVKIPFDLTGPARTSFTTDRNNDGTLEGFNLGDTFIPDQAHILSCEIFMTDTAAAGGTAVTIGTFQVDGTAIDADGLMTAAVATNAAMAANVRLAGNGALINTGVTQRSFLGLVTTGTFTAGRGYALVRYAYGEVV